jgi:hypothetical protein
MTSVAPLALLSALSVKAFAFALALAFLSVIPGGNLLLAQAATGARP